VRTVDELGAGGPSHAPLVTTLVLFACFAAGSIGFREHFAKKRRREAAAAVLKEPPPVIDVTNRSVSLGGEAPESAGGALDSVSLAGEAPAPERP